MNKMNADIVRFVQGIIQQLFHSKAALAQLRRGIGKEPGELPNLLGFVLPSEELTSWHEGRIWQKRQYIRPLHSMPFTSRGVTVA